MTEIEIVTPLDYLIDSGNDQSFKNVLWTLFKTQEKKGPAANQVIMLSWDLQSHFSRPSKPESTTKETQTTPPETLRRKQT